jgi:hypothetical protein
LVAQTRSEHEQQRVIARLKQEGLLLDYISFEQFARFRYLVDIDGNANSWHLMKKLRLGSCVLKVDSDWKQWFDDRLTAWRHYVPVKEDLSDFAEKLQWCRQNLDEAEGIANEGRNFAIRMSFDKEMADAAKKVFG